MNFPSFSLLTSLALMVFTPTALAEDWHSPRFKDHPLTGKIYRVQDGAWLTREGLLDDLNKHALVLVGEKHDNADHHALEKWLANHYLNQPSDQLVLEMLAYPTFVGPHEANQFGRIRDLKALLNWEAEGWPWEDYQAIIESSAGKHIIRGGNIARANIKPFYSEGITRTEQFATTKAIADSVRNQIKDQIFQSHCKMMPKSQLNPFVELQLAKDASLAFTLKEGLKQGANKQLLIAGSFHTDPSVGVPLHLKALNLDSVTITLVEVNATETSPESYSHTLKSDYVWFTPATESVDYCAKMRSHQPNKSN